MDPKDVFLYTSQGGRKDLRAAWKEHILDLDPDLITGYNIFGFDYRFLWDRAEELGCLAEFRQISKASSFACDLTEQNLSSAAFGDNMLTYIDMPGRIQMDLFVVILTTQ